MLGSLTYNTSEVYLYLENTDYLRTILTPMKPLYIKPMTLFRNNPDLDRALDQWPIAVILYYPPSGQLLQIAQEYLVRPRTELEQPYTHLEYWHRGHPYTITLIT